MCGLSRMLFHALDFFSLKGSEIFLILKSLRKNAKESSEKFITVRDFPVILTLHSWLSLLRNLGEDFQNEIQGFRSAFEITAPGHETVPRFSSRLTWIVLGDAFVLLTPGMWGPEWIPGHCSLWELSCAVLSRLFVSLVGEWHRTWQRELLQQGIAVLVIHRQNPIQLHIHFDRNTHYQS